MISTEQIKELRDSTGVSIMQCKKALEEAGGDMEKALMILKKKSGEIALKKADREANDGIIVLKKEGAKAVLIDLSCETDFVARNEDFLKLANDLADIALRESAESAQAKAPDMINPIVQKIGENIKLSKVRSIEGEVLGTYSHNGKAGVIVSLKGGNEDLAKDISMHIAAMKPEYITKDEIPKERVEMAKELFSKEVQESGKPEDIQQKMLEGKISTYFKEATLLEQAFVKNPEITVGTLLKNAGATFAGYVYEKIG